MPKKLSDWLHRQAAQLQRNGKDKADAERQDSLEELCLSNSNGNINAHRRPITPTAQSRPGNGPFFDLPAHLREKIITAIDRTPSPTPASGLASLLVGSHQTSNRTRLQLRLGDGEAAFVTETLPPVNGPPCTYPQMHVSKVNPCHVHIGRREHLCLVNASSASWAGSSRVGSRKYRVLKPTVIYFGLKLTKDAGLRYTETIGLLYSSNVFKFDDWSDTLRYIPRLILPQRLAALRYVEIQYCMRGKTVAETTQADTSPFDALLRSMSQVEMVHISLYGGDLTPLDRKPQMDKVDLKRQRMVYKAGERWRRILTDGRLKHLYLAVPSSVYNRWQEASSRQSNQSTHDYPGPRFWRAINTPAPSSEAATQSPSTETSGYWIVQGMDDYIPRESHCFQPS